mmetsp:Transcript_33283/g.77806  ORF Transcript_33283/g.77806 Transcript_33283/m.77806 type:complete len:222 (-) Transcript_33283:534-1199(-)
MATSGKTAPFCSSCRQSSPPSPHKLTSTWHVDLCSGSDALERSVSSNGAKPLAARNWKRTSSPAVSEANVDMALALASALVPLRVTRRGSSRSTCCNGSRWVSCEWTAVSNCAAAACVAGALPCINCESNSGTLSASSADTMEPTENCGSMAAQLLSALAPCCRADSDSDRISATCLQMHTGSPRSSWSKQMSHTRTGSVKPRDGILACFLQTSDTKICPQ